MKRIEPEQLLVMLQLSSRHVTATVALTHPEHGERVLAHKRIECSWHELSTRGRGQVVAEALSSACAKVEVEPYSVFLSCNDTSLASRLAVGWASPGEERPLTHIERTWALRRAREQATGADREVVSVLPMTWKVRGRDGETEVEDPVGCLGNHLTCDALLISARRGYRQQLLDLVRTLDLQLEDVIPQPLALYRGMSGRMRSRGCSFVIDFGARHTNILVRRKDKLVHVETFGFGGDDLTSRLADDLGLEPEQAETLKREIDIGPCASASKETCGQQFIWTDLQDRHAQLGPATRMCAAAVTSFFKERARELSEHGYLAQQGQIHLVGRASALGGMSLALREIFDLPVVLGTGDRSRHPSEELDGLLESGLVMAAADSRREQLAGRSGSLRKRASGVWSWLTHALN